MFNSVAKTPKKQLHLYGKNEVKIASRPLQKTYTVGIMMHKGHAGFYSMAVYAFPNEFKLSPEMKRMLRGKSCFYVKDLNPRIEKEIASIVEKTAKIFRNKGWV